MKKLIRVLALVAVIALLAMGARLEPDCPAAQSGSRPITCSLK